MTINKKLGVIIKNLRTKKGITLEQLAFFSEFSKGGLSEVERGLREIKISSLEKICKTLDTSLSEFFKHYENEDS